MSVLHLVSTKQAKLLKFSYGTVQVTLDPDSETVKQLQGLQDRISFVDLRAKGKETTFHVTVRYGIQDNETKGIEDYLSSLQPFTINLGRTKVFEATANSDDAAVVYVDVISPELEEINEKLGEIGNFQEKSFDYHPHITLAYVDPEVAKKYVGLRSSASTYVVNKIEVRSKEKDALPKEVILSPHPGVVVKFGKMLVYLPHPSSFVHVDGLLVKRSEEYVGCKFDSEFTKVEQSF